METTQPRDEHTPEQDAAAKREITQSLSANVAHSPQDGPVIRMGLWVHRARCKDEDPELFFPIGTNGPARTQAEMAKAVCERCGVKEACLAWAMGTGQETGVWGGTTEEERRALRRARRRSQLGRYALSPAKRSLGN